MENKRFNLTSKQFQLPLSEFDSKLAHLINIAAAIPLILGSALDYIVHI